MFTVAVGSPFDGIMMYGCYNSHEHATLEAERCLRNVVWWVVEIGGELVEQ